MKSRTTDLTEGSIIRQLLIFSVPILVGQLFQTLYNSVDSIVVGNFVGTNALAAVTASANIAMLLAGFFNGMSAGASVLFSRLFGGRQYRELNRAIHTTILFSIVLGIVLAAIGIVFTPFLLTIVVCPEEVYDAAKTYLRIYLVGILFTSIYNIAAGVLRSVGDSRGPFLFLVISSCLNIVLDVLFVAVFGLGVAGVAIATVLAQLVSVVLSIVRMANMPEEYRFRFRSLCMDGGYLLEIINLGLPAGIQSSIMSISNIYIQRYINSFSSAAIAGIGSGMKIDQFSGMPCMALGLAMTTFIGQNVGAQKYARTHRGVALSTAAVAIEILILSIPIYIFAPQLMRVFGSDSEMIGYGVGFLRTIMPVYLFMGLGGLFGGIVRGYGYSKISMLCSVLGYVVVRQIWLAITLNIEHNIRYIYLGYPISWAASVLLLVAFYFLVIRRKFPSVSPEKETDA